MTVREVKAALSDYPSDMECKLVFKKYCVEHLGRITHCIDSDTNKVTILLCDDGNMEVRE